MGWCKVRIAPLSHSFPIRCAHSASPSSSFPPCEGGARGGGPVSVECTSEACLARSIDKVDGACAAPPPGVACRFRTPLPATREFTDDAEVLRPTPPGPPFTRGGKERLAPPWLSIVRNRNTRFAIVFSVQPSPTISSPQPRPPGIAEGRLDQ